MKPQFDSLSNDSILNKIRKPENSIILDQEKISHIEENQVLIPEKSKNSSEIYEIRANEKNYHENHVPMIEEEYDFCEICDHLIEKSTKLNHLCICIFCRETYPFDILREHHDVCIANNVMESEYFEAINKKANIKQNNPPVESVISTLLLDNRDENKKIQHPVDVSSLLSECNPDKNDSHTKCFFSDKFKKNEDNLLEPLRSLPIENKIPFQNTENITLKKDLWNNLEGKDKNENENIFLNNFHKKNIFLHKKEEDDNYLGKKYQYCDEISVSDEINQQSKFSLVQPHTIPNSNKNIFQTFSRYDNPVSINPENKNDISKKIMDINRISDFKQLNEEDKFHEFLANKNNKSKDLELFKIQEKNEALSLKSENFISPQDIEKDKNKNVFANSFFSQPDDDMNYNLLQNKELGNVNINNKINNTFDKLWDSLFENNTTNNQINQNKIFHESEVHLPQNIISYVDPNIDASSASSNNTVAINDEHIPVAINNEPNFNIRSNVVPKIKKNKKGLPKEVIRRLPKIMKYKINNEEGEHCTICAEDFIENKSLRLLGCFHKFHLKCIMKWLKKKILCPLCNTEVKIDENQNLC